MRNQQLVVRRSRVAAISGRKSVTAFLGMLIVLAGVAGTLAQGLPTQQPKLLTIIREQVKVGRSADHSKFEAAYPAAFEKAKSPDYYLALRSITGPAEVWYVVSRESHAAVGESMKREHKDAALSAELNRLALADTDYISGVQSLLAAGRPDLSLGTFPDISKVRFFAITSFRIRPGRETDFEEAAKAYLGIMKRVAPKSSYRMYEVMAGMPLPTYLAFSSVEDYGEFDQRMMEGEKIFKEAKPEELASLRKFSEAAERVESNHFELDPVQSYVPKETREKDPEFWMGK
jgi:hypothetical protein